MEATHWERDLSRVACLLDELAGKPIDKGHWDGYHPDVYGKALTAKAGDALVAKLCAKLQKTNVKKCSLEMQIWWRDHQIADRERLQRKLKLKRTEQARKAALAKLTPYERKLLLETK